MTEPQTVDLVDAKCPHCDMRIHGEYIEEICEDPYSVKLWECPHCGNKYSAKVMLRIVPQEPDEDGG